MRETLKTQETTLPNQLEKQIKNPTLRWIFQMLEGISIIRFYRVTISNPIREIIANLNDLRKKTINLFGSSAQAMYGLI